MDRRSFLQLASVGTVTAALGFVACSPGIQESQQQADGALSFLGVGTGEVSFTASCDVLVVGSGIAGLSAAMDPSEAGYKVIVADKETLLGGESYRSSGMLNVYGTRLQKDAGITKTAEDYWQMRKESFDERYPDADIASEDLLRTICGLRAGWVDRLVDRYHASFQDPRDWQDAGVDESIIVPRAGLEGLEDVMNPLRDQLAEQGVEYLLGQSLEAFVVDDGGVLRGARFRSPEGGTFIDVAARKIVLACGGYAASQKIIADNLPMMLSTGCTTSLDDGAAMMLAWQAGADVTNLDLLPSLLGDVPAVDAWGCFGPVVAVGPNGERFAREDERFACPNACFEQELGFWWTLFDQQMGKGLQSSSVAKTLEKYPNRHVGPFDTIEELAEATGLASEKLKETLEAYAKACKDGADEAFGRNAHLLPLEAPYQAVKQFPVRFRTMGGLRVDSACCVLDTLGDPVKNLYAAGSCAAIMSEGFLDNAASGLLAGAAVAEALDADSATGE